MLAGVAPPRNARRFRPDVWSRSVMTLSCPDPACQGLCAPMLPVPGVSSSVNSAFRVTDQPRGIAMQPAHDPSSSSYYVTDAFYRDLVAQFADWQRDDLTVADLAQRDRFRMLIEREARLLDQLKLDEWLAMYAPECIYWVPAPPQGGDPRREV